MMVRLPGQLFLSYAGLLFFTHVWPVKPKLHYILRKVDTINRSNGVWALKCSQGFLHTVVSAAAELLLVTQWSVSGTGSLGEPQTHGHFGREVARCVQ